MKKLLVYPADSSNASIVRNHMMLCDYELSAVSVSKGRGLNQQDASILDKGSRIGITLSEDFESKLQQCDAVLFLPKDGSIDGYTEKLALARQNEKDILLCKSIYKALQADFGTMIGGNSVNHEKLIEKSQLKTIPVPVVSIFGVGELCNKFDILCVLQNHFKKQGYNVLSFGTKDYSPLFGMNCLPDFLFDSNVAFEKKIIALNHYIYEMVKANRSDICILAVPGGVVPLDETFHNYFAELPYIISCAARSDVAILSLHHFAEMNENFLQKIREHLYHKFNCIVDYFHLSNTTYSINYGELNPKMLFLRYDFRNVEKTLDQVFSKTDLNVFNIFCGYEPIAEKIQRELATNVATV